MPAIGWVCKKKKCNYVGKGCDSCTAIKHRCDILCDKFRLLTFFAPLLTGWMWRYTVFTPLVAFLYFALPIRSLIALKNIFSHTLCFLLLLRLVLSIINAALWDCSLLLASVFFHGGTLVPGGFWSEKALFFFRCVYELTWWCDVEQVCRRAYKRYIHSPGYATGEWMWNRSIEDTLNLLQCPYFNIWSSS